MKKIMTFALMALMLGFAYNVNAQNKGKAVKTTATEEAVQTKASKKVGTTTKAVSRTTAPDAKASAPQAQKKQPNTVETKKATEMNKTLKDYEETVDACVKLYQEMKKYEKSASVNPDKFNQSLKKAEDMKAKIEKSKDQMDRTQVDRFNKANQKLSQVYTKG